MSVAVLILLDFGSWKMVYVFGFSGNVGGFVCRSDGDVLAFDNY